MAAKKRRAAAAAAPADKPEAADVEELGKYYERPRAVQARRDGEEIVTRDVFGNEDRHSQEQFDDRFFFIPD
jgi:hypothetical protein